MYFRDFLKNLKLSLNEHISRQLVEYTLDYKQTDRLSLFDGSIPLSKKDIDHLNNIFKRLSQNEPLSYINNKRIFFKDEFYVDPNVMIPRYETEILVERLNQIATGKEILELGSGSGCISISCLKHSNAKSFVSTDISIDSLYVTNKNAFNLLDKVRRNDLMTICCDRFSAVKGKFDTIVSNPPYIDYNDYLSLEDSVKDFEPKHALTDDKDGLSFYRYILSECERLLKKGGTIFLEHGYDQKEQLELLCENKFKEIESISDYSGHDRFILAKGFLEK